ncbi:MAG: hypothetical protein ABIH26_01650 [Candidatus Eisenbacteria bacterium]
MRKIVPLLLILALPAAAQETRLDLESRDVTFRIEAPGAGKVSVVGDFNCWNEYVHVLQQEEGGTWTKTLRLRTGKVYEYAFAVDGRWLPDPNNGVRSHGGKLSIVFLPGGKDDADLLSPEAGGSASIILLYKKLDARLAALQQQTETLLTLVDRQAQDLARKDSELTLLRNETASLRVEKSNASRDATDLRKKVQELETRCSEIETASGLAPEKIEEMNRQLAQARSSQNTAQTRYNELLQQNRDNEQTIREMTENLARTRNDLDQLQKRYMELAEEMREKNEILRAVGISANPAPPPPEAGPLAGEVVAAVDAVSPESNLLLISAGKNRGIESGDPLVVLRDGKVIGRLTVETAYDTWSSAVVPEGFDWREMKRGDEVAFERK